MDPGAAAFLAQVRGTLDPRTSDYRTNDFVVIGQPTQFDVGSLVRFHADQGLPFWETRWFLRYRQLKSLFMSLGAAV